MPRRSQAEVPNCLWKSEYCLWKSVPDSIHTAVNTNYITKSAPSKMRRNIGRDTRRSILRQGQEQDCNIIKENQL